MAASNPARAIAFIIDNNPEQVEVNLNSRGLLNNPDPSRDDLLAAIEAIDSPEVFSEILAVPYIENQTNYTANLADDLQRETLENRSGFLLIANGLLTVAASAFNWQGSRANADAAAQAAEAERIRAAADQQNRVLGLPMNSFLILAGLVALVIVVVIIANRRK